MKSQELFGDGSKISQSHLPPAPTRRLKTFNSNAKTSDSSVAYCGVGIDMLGTICDLLWHFREKSKRIS